MYYFWTPFQIAELYAHYPVWVILAIHPQCISNPVSYQDSYGKPNEHPHSMQSLVLYPHCSILSLAQTGINHCCCIHLCCPFDNFVALFGWLLFRLDFFHTRTERLYFSADLDKLVCRWTTVSFSWIWRYCWTLSKNQNLFREGYLAWIYFQFFRLILDLKSLNSLATLDSIQPDFYTEFCLLPCISCS